MTQHSRDTPQFYLTAPSPCPYLAGKEERKVFTHLVGERAAELNDILTQGGFRRSQSIAYRPACEGCRGCVSVRVVAKEFQPTRSMRRIANRNADKVVIAAGAWSAQLLAQLGVRVPLETERGYHAMLFSPSVTPPIPISSKTRAFFMTPMEDGLRVAGTVEIAGLDAPPDERRAQVLVEHARRLFPGLQAGEVRYWMGFRPSTPDSLPILGPVQRHPGLHLAFGHPYSEHTGACWNCRTHLDIVGRHFDVWMDDEQIMADSRFLI